MEQFSRKHVKTRKEHQCFACLGVFPAGTIMESQTNKGNGDIYTLYTCNDCEQIMKDHYLELFDDYEEVFPWGCVREWKNTYRR